LDIHVHTRGGLSALAPLDPDLIGVQAGVVALMDCGTFTVSSYRAFPSYIVPNAQTDMYALLLINDTTRANGRSPKSDKDLDLDRFARVIDENRSWLKGVKIILNTGFLEGMGTALCKAAVQLARDTGTRVMVPESPTVTRRESLAKPWTCSGRVTW
jgi:predicted amidohydrolase